MRCALVLMCVLLAGCQTVNNQQKPQDLRSVLSEVKRSFNVQDARVKYCPVCGKHYSGHLETCPDDHAKLVPIE